MRKISTHSTKQAKNKNKKKIILLSLKKNLKYIFILMYFLSKLVEKLLLKAIIKLIFTVIPSLLFWLILLNADCLILVIYYRIK